MWSTVSNLHDPVSPQNSVRLCKTCMYDMGCGEQHLACITLVDEAFAIEKPEACHLADWFCQAATWYRFLGWSVVFHPMLSKFVGLEPAVLGPFFVWTCILIIPSVKLSQPSFFSFRRIQIDSENHCAPQLPRSGCLSMWWNCSRFKTAQRLVTRPKR